MQRTRGKSPSVDAPAIQPVAPPPPPAGPVASNTPFSRVVALLCGLVFGFALHKAGVYRAAFIIQQFQFTNFRMLKVRVGWGWNGCWPFDTTCLPP